MSCPLKQTKYLVPVTHAMIALRSEAGVRVLSSAAFSNAHGTLSNA